MRLRDEHGGALVETAISMLVFVPVLFYALMLDDLLRYRLNQQEAVGGAVWDLTTRDYEKRGSNGYGDDGDSAAKKHASYARFGVQKTYCDHTSAYDSYDSNYDCQETDHHAAVAAHQCWQHGKASEVICAASTGDPMRNAVPENADGRLVGASYNPAGLPLGSIASLFGPSPASFADTYTHGGYFKCWGRLSVLNYLMPQEFLSGLYESKNKLSERKKFEDDNVHSAAGGAAEADVFLFPYYTTSILTDTWALNKVEDLHPDEDRKRIPFHTASSHEKEFQRRVEDLYRSGLFWIIYMARAAYFLFEITISNQFLTPGVVPLLTADPFETHMALKHGELRDRAGVADGNKSEPPKFEVSEEDGLIGIPSDAEYYATPWQDWNEDPYQETYGSRGKWYLGCDEPEKC